MNGKRARIIGKHKDQDGDMNYKWEIDGPCDRCKGETTVIRFTCKPRYIQMVGHLCEKCERKTEREAIARGRYITRQAITDYKGEADY